MWLCHRLSLCRCYSRAVVIRDGNPSVTLTLRGDRVRPSFVLNSVKWDWCKLRKCAVKVIRLCHSSSSKYNQDVVQTSRSTFFQFIKWGVLAVFVTTLASTSFVCWEVWSLQQNLSTVTATFNSDQNVPSSSHMILDLMYHTEGDTHGSNSSKVLWFPWIQSKSQDPFMLLELCRADNPAIRQMGVKALANKTNWEDYQYRYVAQAADNRTLIGLSRSRGADSRFFRQQPSIGGSEVPLFEELAVMLLQLDQKGKPRSINSSKGKPPIGSIGAMAQHYLQQQQRAKYDKRHFWGFSGSSLDVASVSDALPPEDQLLLQFLEAAAQLCCTADLASLFVGNRGLVTLQRVIEQYQNTATFTAVATILGNLAMHPSVHGNIVHTGWLSVLKSWAEGKNSKLAVMAARALANLDMDWSTELLDDGIVVLHPLWRSRKTVHADVVFVHGLLGGAVKTWRQQDLIPGSQSQSDSGPRTDCWPKDWLAGDCPHIRILSVHYDTALSLWSGNNTVHKEKCTLEGRSSEILDKLTKAGVGSRPIIWVGHSMGGLLVKQMLQLCDSGNHWTKKRETCGFLLYSVPHRGISIAALSNHASFLFWPSVEVQELSADSRHLHGLQENFKQFVETNSIPCLSFGEQFKTQFRKTLPRLLLVPPASSDPGVGEFCLLPVDHISICKPESRDSILYQRSLNFIHSAIFFSYMHRIRQVMSDALD